MSIEVKIIAPWANQIEGKSFVTTDIVSLLTDHLVITPKYRGKILTGEVAFIVEAIIRATCAEMSIKIIDMAVNADLRHLPVGFVSCVHNRDN